MKGEEALPIFALFQKADDYKTLYWTADPEGNQIRLWADCSDWFFWATADGEEITPGDVPLLETSLDDLLRIGAAEYLSELYASRKRRLRPQAACYKDMPEAVKPLFDACSTAEEREAADKADAAWWVSVAKKVSAEGDQPQP